MGSNEGSVGWSVFDTVKFLPSSPDALMAEINAAIAALEYTQVTARLGSSLMRGNGSVRGSVSVYDADIAEEAYQLGCAALSEGKVDAGLESLHISLSKCPPDQIDAVAKIRSLISFTAQKLQKSSK
ncbi:uncharacterized protein LOC110696573 [Chenopodium quinoa]|uniref:Uncharacterized protein n=1 Tax=Chenopodium quinoa TaxID=63459 RepID=A0A803M2I3_CHEQI|nr:uncharacterized protein LOC110696573 [Chenopodium quinoa]